MVRPTVNQCSPNIHTPVLRLVNLFHRRRPATVATCLRFSQVECFHQPCPPVALDYLPRLTIPRDILQVLLGLLGCGLDFLEPDLHLVLPRPLLLIIPKVRKVSRSIKMARTLLLSLSSYTVQGLHLKLPVVVLHSASSYRFAVPDLVLQVNSVHCLRFSQISNVLMFLQMSLVCRLHFNRISLELVFDSLAQDLALDLALVCLLKVGKHPQMRAMLRNQRIRCLVCHLHSSDLDLVDQVLAGACGLACWVWGLVLAFHLVCDQWV